VRVRTASIAVGLTLGALLATNVAAGDGERGRDAPGTARVDSVREFTLKDLEGIPRSLSDLRDATVVVLAWTAPGCPVSQVYAPRLAEIARTHAARGVRFLGVSSNAGESVTELAAHAKETGIPFPIVLDEDGALAQRLGVTTTTAVAVLDANRRVRYRGAVDDQYGVGGRKPAPGRRFLLDAIESVLAAKPVATERTEAPGCAITFPAPTTPTTALTWNRDVASIVRARCATCHAEGRIGPFALGTFGDVKSRTAMVRQVVSEGRMPPWHADAPRGTFANDLRLEDEEKKTLLAWIEGGAPEGDAKDAPPPPPKPAVPGSDDEWSIGPPDVVLSFPKPVAVPAEGVVPYRYVEVPTDYDEDRWVTASEVKPGAPGVVHHVLVAAVPKDRKRRGGAFNPVEGFFSAMVPGGRPVPYPPDHAKRLPKGSTLLFQMHYTPNGVATQDVTRIGLVFAKGGGPPKHEVFTAGAFNPGLRIPPGVERWEVPGLLPVPFDVKILTYMPHMHLRGVAFRYELVRGLKVEKVLLSVPRYDFNWQMPYRLNEPVFVPKFAFLRAVGTYDNSAKNPYNPNPDVEVRWGDQTWDEMMIGYVDYVRVP
jgi:peroxiredoxin